MQFQDGLGSRRDGRIMIVCKALSLPAVLAAVVFVISFGLSLLAVFPLPAFFCCKEIGFKIWVGTAASIVAIPFIAFSLAWAIVGLAVWLFLLPCGAGEVHLQFLLGVPFMTALTLVEGLIMPAESR